MSAMQAAGVRELTEGLVVEDVPIPVPGPGQALVNLVASDVCPHCITDASLTSAPAPT